VPLVWASLFTKSLSDLSCGIYGDIDVKTQSLGLLSRGRKIREHGLHTGRAQPKQIKPDILDCQQTRFELRFHRLSTILEFDERIPLPL
jgi:hypothetical protein